MKDVIKELVGWIVSILLIVAVSYLIVTFVGQRTQVSGSSMETTLSDGDHLIVDKISYRFREPQRYEIVVISVPICKKNTYYIKRIIGLPGGNGSDCRRIYLYKRENSLMSITEMK